MQLSKTIKTLKDCINNKIPFASFKLPYEDEIHTYIQNSKLTVLEDKNFPTPQSGFVFHPFTQNSSSPFLILEPEKIIENNLNQVAESVKPAFQIKNSIIQKVISSDKDVFISNVEKAKNIIKSSDIQKIVLSRKLNFEIGKQFDIFNFYLNTCKNYSNTFNYVFYSPATGIWLGASPELLCKKTNQSLEFVSLAGTHKNNSDNSKNITWGSKELHEQKLVTDCIHQILKTRNFTPTTIDGPKTIQIGNISHLKTTLTTSLNPDYSLMQLLKEIHPSPSVAGLPKKKSFNHIKTIEQYDRDYYCGFLGPLNIENITQIYVNIRCMHITDKKLSIFAGAGITKDSIAENEWLETSNKAMALLSVLQK